MGPADPEPTAIGLGIAPARLSSLPGRRRSSRWTLRGEIRPGSAGGDRLADVVIAVTGTARAILDEFGVLRSGGDWSP